MFAAAVVLFVLVAALEINDSPLVNPDWPPHVRLHEAWQLLTNAGIGAFAAWRMRRERLGAGLALVVVRPLITAYAFRAPYGGSMNRFGGEDGILTGGGAPVVVMLIIAAGLIRVIGTGGPVSRRRRAPDLNPT